MIIIAPGNIIFLGRIARDVTQIIALYDYHVVLSYIFLILVYTLGLRQSRIYNERFSRLLFSYIYIFS
jgi:hypothetical protein